MERGFSTELLKAVKEGDITFIQSRKLTEEKVDEDGANCLHYVCRAGSVKFAQILVEDMNFDVSKTTKYGSTIMHDAVALGNMEVVKWIWSNTKLNIDQRDSDGATAIHIAALYGQLLVVHWLINNTSCDLMSKTDKGATCLHFAVASGNLKVTKIILAEIPRSINLQMSDGTTAAYLACQLGYLDTLKYLVEKGANLNMKCFDGMSCTHAACQGGHLDVVKWLVKEQKVNVNGRDLDGASCLHFAASNGHAEVVKWMVKEGGAKITMDNLGGSPLHNAAELGHIQVVKALVENGCDLDLTDNEGLTAAELAEKCNQNICAEFIRGKLNIEDFSSIDFNFKSNARSIVANGPVKPDLLGPRDNIKFPEFETYQYQTPPQFPVHQSSTAESHQPLSTGDHQSGNGSNHFDQYNLSLSNQFQNLNNSDDPHLPDGYNVQEEESTEYIVPEKDYPEDDEDLPSRLTIQSFETQNYERQQLTPEKYAPPPAPPPPPPKTESEKVSSDNESEAANMMLDLSGIDHQSQELMLDTSGSGSQSHGVIINLSGDYNQSHQVTSDELPPSSPTSTLTSTSLKSELNETKVSFNHDQKQLSVDSKPAKEVTNIGNAKPKNENDPTKEPVLPKKSSPRFFTFDKIENQFIQNPIVLPTASRQNSNTSESIASNVNLMSELKQLHLSRSESNLYQENENDVEESTSVVNSDQKTDVNVNRSRPLSFPGLADSVTNLVEELKKKNQSDLNVTKKPNESQEMKLVFSLGSNPVNGTNSQDKKTDTTKAKETKKVSLTGDFDPKNFLEKVPDVDAKGTQYPVWRKQLLARQLAEKAMKEAEEKQKEEEYEARFKNMPAWKRQMIERKESHSSK